MRVFSLRYSEMVMSTNKDRLEQFLYYEAQLQDQHLYTEWENLWESEDTLYWVPMGEDPDPALCVSYIYDNRARLATRIRQLNSGKRHAQMPRSRLSRVVSNITFEQSGDEVSAKTRFILLESRRSETVIWGGDVEFLLRDYGSHYRIKQKRVNLTFREEGITTLAFLI